MLKNAVKIKDI